MLWREVVKSCNRTANRVLWFFVSSYRVGLAPHLGGGCRFHPSCSQYALDAIKVHNPLEAVRLIGIRLIKCRPFGAYGYDPVPGFDRPQLCASVEKGS